MINLFADAHGGTPVIQPLINFFHWILIHIHDVIGSYGILRGTVLAAWRILRCNPFSHGGYDPVSAQNVFRASHS